MIKSPQINKFDNVYHQIKLILNEARHHAYRAVNFAMVQAYWQIGKIIVEEEQWGKERAGYGEFIVKELSKKVTIDFGNGLVEPI